MSITRDQLENLSSTKGNVFDSDGDKIGSVGQFYLDDTTGEPSWVTVKTGLFGTAESFAPLEGASVQGSDVRVGYDKAKVKDAPRVADDGSLSPEEEDRLYSHYGIYGSGSNDTTDMTDSVTSTGGYDSGADTSGRDTAGTGVLADGGADHGRTDIGDDTVGHDTSGPTTDNAMTRSEERLNVGTRSQEAGRARMRKYVVTENVSTTVPVSHEEVRVEREPITDGNYDSAMGGPAISEEEHEVTLHEEVPVVEKTAVPVERVRLDTETVTEQQTVTEEVRKEQIDVDGPGTTGDTTSR